MFQLPKLPWGEKDLEPYISSETIQYHYGKHHMAYISKLNDLAKGTEWEKKSVSEIVKQAEGTIFNQAAQVWNHNFYWESLTPKSSYHPKGELEVYINKSFGNYDAFKKAFSDIAAGHFGSGWAWLIYDEKSGTLKVHGTHDALNPLRDGSGIPLLTCDVWEHAYYIDYRNARAKYIEAWWHVVNWDFAEMNFEACLTKKQ